MGSVWSGKRDLKEVILKAGFLGWDRGGFMESFLKYFKVVVFRYINNIFFFFKYNAREALFTGAEKGGGKNLQNTFN